MKIENGGGETVQLRHRHWQITDGNGRLQEVRGPGVVGEQPVLAPGESFEYTSSCPLPTPSGFMVGDYEMETRGGESFLVRVPAFSLDTPQRWRPASTDPRTTTRRHKNPAAWPRRSAWHPDQEENAMAIIANRPSAPEATIQRQYRRANAGRARRPSREEALEAVRTLIRWAGDDPEREGPARHA